jgi:hypothetical protein
MRKGVLMTCAALVVATTTHAYAQITTSSVPFTTANRGAATIETIGGTDPVVLGYARVEPVASTTPTAVALIDYRQNDVLVSEAGIPGVLPILSGRTYAEIGTVINTGLAFVNPGETAVDVSFYFTTQAGRDVSQGTFRLNARAQIARFLNEAPFNMTPFTGSFTFTATAPVAVTAVRTLVNERSEFLLTPEVVAALPSAISAGTLVVAHFADGGGWKTEMMVVNPSDTAISGTLSFFNEGSPTQEAMPLASFNYALDAHTATSFATSATATSARVGSVRIIPTGGTTPPSAFAVVSLKSGGVTVSQATIPAQTPANTFRTHIEMRPRTTVTEQGVTTVTGPIQSAVAIANNSATSATITFELTTMDGTNTNQMTTVDIAPFGHVSKFVADIFPGIVQPFQGVLRITSFNTIAVASLRTRNNARDTFLFATIAVSNEAAPSTNNELIFPQIADRGGYTTQFILFSGAASQNTTGMLRFARPDGQDLNLTVR